MVYDDTRWVNKLVAMGVWNESEARKRFEEALKRKRMMQQTKMAEQERKRRAAAGLPENKIGMGSTLFDMDEHTRQQTQGQNAPAPMMDGNEMEKVASLADEVDFMSLNNKKEGNASMTQLKQLEMLGATVSDAALTVFTDVRSARGFARQEYGRIHAALWPFYVDLVSARSHADPVVFRKYRNPEDQAVMLSQLRAFSKSDSAVGWSEREDRLNSMTSIFENAVLREFEG